MSKPNQDNLDPNSRNINTMDCNQICFQISILYTDVSTRKRKLRVITANQVTTTFKCKFTKIDLNFSDEAIQTMNPDFCFSLWAKRYLLRFGDSSVPELRLSMSRTLKELVRDYVSTFPLELNPKKLQLPANLRHLVGYFYGLNKSLLYDTAQARKANHVEYLRRRLLNCQIPELVNSFYPKVYDLLDFENFTD